MKLKNLLETVAEDTIIRIIWVHNGTAIYSGVLEDMDPVFKKMVGSCVKVSQIYAEVNEEIGLPGLTIAVYD